VATPTQDALVCPSCKAPYVIGDAFCFNCGADLTSLGGNAGANGATANGNGQATAVAATVAAPAASQPAAQDDGMSTDDWDKAFAAPATTNGSAPAAPSAPVAAVSAPVNEPDTAAPAASTNAFAAPLAEPAAASAPVVTAPPASTGTLKLHIAGPYGDEVLEYKGHELLLGRQDVKTRVFPDVNLDDSAASRRHLSIWRDDQDGFFYAQDLESSNGTTLNGRDMEPGGPTRLNNGDLIRIGTRYSIQVRIS
jgi:hypothetical protein